MRAPMGRGMGAGSLGREEIDTTLGFKERV